MASMNAYEFADDSFDKLHKEEYAIWAQPYKGMLLTVESYNDRSTVNSSDLYYELILPKDLDNIDELEQILMLEVLKGSSHTAMMTRKGVTKQAVCVRRDAREGLVSHLRKLGLYNHGTNNPWRHYDEHFLWLCDFSETRDKNYDYKRIERKKVARLPLDVRQMLGVDYNKK